MRDEGKRHHSIVSHRFAFRIEGRQNQTSCCRVAHTINTKRKALPGQLKPTLHGEVRQNQVSSRSFYSQIIPGRGALPDLPWSKIPSYYYVTVTGHPWK
jgi:hypothetical protein